MNLVSLLTLESVFSIATAKSSKMSVDKEKCFQFSALILKRCYIYLILPFWTSTSSPIRKAKSFCLVITLDKASNPSFWSSNIRVCCFLKSCTDCRLFVCIGDTSLSSSSQILLPTYGEVRKSCCRLDSSGAFVNCVCKCINCDCSTSIWRWRRSASWNVTRPKFDDSFSVFDSCPSSAVNCLSLKRTAGWWIEGYWRFMYGSSQLQTFYILPPDSFEYSVDSRGSRFLSTISDCMSRLRRSQASCSVILVIT